MTVIFSNVEAEITDDLIGKFSSEFDFDAMLRKVCEDAGVLIEIETETFQQELEDNAKKDNDEPRNCKYKLKGLWVAMEKAYRNLMTTVALYGSRLADGDPTDEDLSDILQNPLSDDADNDESDNEFSKSILENNENKSKRRPRKSAVQSRKLINTMTREEDEDIFDGVEVSFSKTGETEEVQKDSGSGEDFNELEGKENNSKTLEENVPVVVKRGRGRPRKGTTKSSVTNKSTKKKGRPKKCPEEVATTSEYPCPQCSYVAKRRYKLKSHISEVHQKDPTHCPICDKVFPNRKYMLRHQESHGGPQHCCDICGKMYKIKRALQNHRKTHEPSYSKPSFRCNECPKTFCNQYVLDMHIRDIHRGMKKSYLCSVCGKSFTTKHSLAEHSNAHNGLKPYECQTCGKAFAYESALRDHKYSHIEKSFWCSHCQKSFSQRSGLKVHMRTHRLHKMFVCSECGRGFTQKQALQRHERVHKGEKPFICKHCGKYFTDASIIRRHLILVHKIKKKAREWREDIVCTIVADKDHHVQKVSEEEMFSTIEREKEEVMRNVGLQSKSDSKKGPSRAFHRIYPRKVVVLDDEDNVIQVPEEPPAVPVSTKPSSALRKRGISAAHSDEPTMQLKVIHAPSVLSPPVLGAPEGNEIDPQVINHRYIDHNQWEALTGHLTKGAAQLEPIILEDASQQEVHRNQGQVLNLQKIIKCETAPGGIVTVEATSHPGNQEVLHSPRYSPVSFTPLSHSNSSKPQESQFESLTAQLANTSGQYYDIRNSSSSSSHTAVPWSSMYYYSHLANQLGINIGSDLSYINATSANTATGGPIGSCVIQSSVDPQQLAATSLVVHKSPQDLECDASQPTPHLTNSIPVPSTSLDSTNSIPCVPNIPALIEPGTLQAQKLSTDECSPAQSIITTTTTIL